MLGVYEKMSRFRALLQASHNATKKMSRFRTLLQASLNATKKALTWNVDDLMPPAKKCIFNFNSKEELKKWNSYSDSEYGGIFSGNLSLNVNEGSKWNLTRSGFCGMRSKKRRWQKLYIYCKDLRSYISTIYTENWVNLPGQGGDNSWQAFVFVPKDNWYITKIPLARYVPTWRGNVINAQLEMNPSRVVGMSLSVNAEGGVPGATSGRGDFRVELDWIKALRTE